MINLTVLNIKDVIKSLVKFIAIIIFVIICTRLFNLMKDINIKEMINNKFKDIEGKTYLEVINDNISILKGKVNQNINIDENNNNEKSSLSIFNLFDNILSKEISFFAYADNISNQKSESNFNGNKKNEDEIKYANSKDAKTEVIEENNKKDTYNKIYNGVKIKNESKYKLTEEDLKPDIDFKNKEDIVIYHTHTCESYTKTEKYTYKNSGNFRTTDLNYSVARVGEELKKYLDKYDFNVIHNKTYHDYPKYNGSYTRSLETIEKILKTSKASLVIDLHRDALGSNSKYAPSVKINGEEAAQLMFVIGTDGGGLKHDKWKKNLKLAIKIQEKANEMYPGLFKPIIVRNSRYNQHVSEGACIIEVGATGNTLEQCLVSMKYLSSVIFEVMKEE